MHSIAYVQISPAPARAGGGPGAGRQIVMMTARESAMKSISCIGFVTHSACDMHADSTHYLHRAGRVGRAGNPGAVISFCRCGEGSVIRRFARELSLHMHRVVFSHGRIWVIGKRDQTWTAKTEEEHGSS